MLIIFGLYTWGRKLVGYKRDLCFRCKTNTIWHRRRYIPVFHIFWIPLIPLGIYKEWICDQCGKSPKGRSSTTSGIIFGLVGIPFGLLGLLMIAAGVNGDIVTVLCGLLMLGVCLALVGTMIYKIRASRKHKQIRQEIHENSSSLLNEPCLYCQGQIQIQNKPACIACGARIYETVDDFAPLKGESSGPSCY